MNYEKYLADMKKFNAKPMSQKEFNLMQGIESEVEIPCSIARKSSSAKQIAPILKAHTELKKVKR